MRVVPKVARRLSRECQTRENFNSTLLEPRQFDAYSQFYDRRAGQETRRLTRLIRGSDATPAIKCRYINSRRCPTV